MDRANIGVNNNFFEDRLWICVLDEVAWHCSFIINFAVGAV
jgi:hypothetical protein